MKRVNKIVTACAAAVLLTLTISVAAQDFNSQERTFMTFSGPVELPGLRLEAGTYVFRLADTPSRNVVQVLSQDEKDMLGQWLFVQAERPEVSGETVVTFKETNPGTTAAVQYWYYPGEKIGKEFIYPKDQAMRIAARTGATVKTEEGDVTATGQVAAADVSVPATSETTAVPEASASASASGVVEGSGLPADIDVQADSQAQTSASAEVSADTAVGTSGAGDQSASASAGIQQESTSARADTLPATASPLALSGLLGLLSLAGAAGIRFFRS
jgi:hypothetical protein